MKLVKSNFQFLDPEGGKLALNARTHLTTILKNNCTLTLVKYFIITVYVLAAYFALWNPTFLKLDDLSYILLGCLG